MVPFNNLCATDTNEEKASTNLTGCNSQSDRQMEGGPAQLKGDSGHAIVSSDVSWRGWVC